MSTIDAPSAADVEWIEARGGMYAGGKSFLLPGVGVLTWRDGRWTASVRLPVPEHFTGHGATPADAMAEQADAQEQHANEFAKRAARTRAMLGASTAESRA